MESEFITIREAAAVLKMSYQSVRASVRSGKFESSSYRHVPKEERKNRGGTDVLRAQIERLAREGYGSRLFDFDGKTPSSEDCIYRAALIDGEGSIIISRPLSKNGKATFSVGVTVVNPYRPVIDWVCETFGGSVQARQRKGTWRPCYPSFQWCTAAYRPRQRGAPFMKIKHRQAMLAIEFYEHMVAFSETGRSQILPDGVRDWREEQWRLLKRYTAGELSRSSALKPGCAAAHGDPRFGHGVS